MSVQLGKKGDFSGQAGELKTARDLWRSNLTRSPECAKAAQRVTRLALAKSLETDLPEEAKKLYEEARKEAESIQALKGLARLAKGKESAGLWARAVAEEEKASTWAEPALYLELAGAHKASGDLPAAEAACRRAEEAVKAAHLGREWKARLKACPVN